MATNLGIKMINSVPKPSRKCAFCKKTILRGKYCNNICQVKMGKRRLRARNKSQISITYVDHLYQEALKRLYPKSIISGEPTEVIHHFILKSQSNNLRFDIDNGIPLTNKEHSRHHLSGDPVIVATIVKKKGFEWLDGLESKRRVPNKLNQEYLANIINILEGL